MYDVCFSVCILDGVVRVSRNARFERTIILVYVCDEFSSREHSLGLLCRRILRRYLGK